MQLEDKVQEALNSISQSLRLFTPKRTGVTLVIRETYPGLDDHLIMEDEDWFEEDRDQATINPLPVTSFATTDAGPVVAVDCGCKKLGETEDGLVIALRAAVVIDDGENSRAKLYRTGPLYLSHRHKAEIFYAVGNELGEPDYYVTLDESDPPKPTRVKGGVADKNIQFSDRFRAFLERLVQRVAVVAVQNGTILFDGALTLRTRDCPDSYMKGLATLGSRKGNSIVAVSKTSDLQVQGKSIRFWLDDARARPGYRDLSTLLNQDNSVQARGRAERVMGNVYSARFSALGPTFRVDVKPPRGGSDKEALDQFFASARMRGGYPDILVRAHALSYFSSEAVMQLQAQACAQFGLRPQPDVSMAATFSPFGGRYK